MKSQGWIKDAIISLVGSALIYIGSQMRDDFKTLVISVNNLTTKLEVLTSEVANEQYLIRDHETRLREVENDNNSRKVSH
jgi:hypothetical protein